MVRFLIHRPVAVTMVFLALLLIGLATTTNLPVSLMPDIDIPVVTVRVTSSDLPARQLENSVVKTIRNTLKEVNHVEGIKSETRDGSAWIELRFRHGTPVDLASIEVNEKVDKAMNYLPRSIARPEVTRASASDIPVFYLIIHQKSQEPATPNQQGFVPNSPLRGGQGGLGSQGGLPLSSFASQVIRKRLEQLPEVALVDMSGLQFPEIKIRPNPSYLQSGAFSIAQLEQALTENNLDLGNLLIRDGQYQFNIRFNTRLRDIADISAIPVNLNGRVVKLGDVADIKLEPQPATGNIRYNSMPAVSLAVIKQSDAKMASLKKELDFMVAQFTADYPELSFAVARDQTRLLRYSISNLWQSLLLGGFLAFLAMFFFLRERRAPWLIGASIPISLILSLFFFYLARISINIVSLSGLVLGVGMMIDNSIIVIDNITQHRQRHSSLGKACTDGTNEVIAPLISSVLTTCAVFIPLVFMSGMAGALFFDQSVAVSIGLGASLIIAITLLPVLYRMIYLKHTEKDTGSVTPSYFKWYEAGLRFIMHHQGVAVILTVVMLGSIPLLWNTLPLTRFPEVSQTETIVKIDWNEPVTLDENNRRVSGLLSSLKTKLTYSIEEAGRQQYLLANNDESATSENKLILKTETTEELKQLTAEIAAYLPKVYPSAAFTFTESENLFNLTFGKKSPPLVAKLTHADPDGQHYLAGLGNIVKKIETSLGDKGSAQILTRPLILIESDPEKLLFYNVGSDELYRAIKNAFNVNTVFNINDNNVFIPVTVGNSPRTVFEIVRNLSVTNKTGEEIPLSGLVTVSNTTGLKTVVAGQEGEYFPLNIDIEPKDLKKTMALVKSAAEGTGFDVSFEGAIQSDKKMLSELTVIILISLLLLYFILAAQFESVWLPAIVLFEVPVDIFGALLMLKLFGAGINIMSGIGIIVMMGIIINDSILKIDTINRLIKEDYSLIHAIFEAGRRRLKPIIMTSLTTILALMPMLFQKGLGAELQAPLSLSLIGGMVVGTLVSLYIIPMLYYLLKRYVQFNPKK